MGGPYPIEDLRLRFKLRPYPPIFNPKFNLLFCLSYMFSYWLDVMNELQYIDSPPNMVSSSFLFDSNLLYWFSVSLVISSLDDTFGTMKLYILSLLFWIDNGYDFILLLASSLISDLAGSCFIVVIDMSKVLPFSFFNGAFELIGEF